MIDHTFENRYLHGNYATHSDLKHLIFRIIFNNQLDVTHTVLHKCPTEFSFQ